MFFIRCKIASSFYNRVAEKRLMKNKNNEFLNLIKIDEQLNRKIVGAHLVASINTVVL